MTDLDNHYVGIGTETPQQKLHVKGRIRFTGRNSDSSKGGPAAAEFFADTSGDLFAFHVVSITDHPLAFGTATHAPDMVLWQDGSLSLGRESVAAPTRTVSSHEVLRLTRPGAGNSGGTGGSYITLGTSSGQQLTRIAQQPSVGGYDLAFHTWRGAGGLQEKMRIGSDGNVVIGGSTVPTSGKLHVAGDVVADGKITAANIQANFQDVAEWVPSVDDLSPGTVVVLEPSHRNTVQASFREYDQSVAGVVSGQPGVILGQPGASKELIATTGRVHVRVDATRHPIRVGDLLVTSNRIGTAMRSQPVAIGDVKIHRPGTIIGKALEPLPRGSGEILVLLSLQ
jgi:hypothetical protein